MTVTADFYWRYALAATPRLLGTLDRERFSPTAGSFDRDHWGWHFRDAPIGMLQTGVLPLAAVWTLDAPDNPYYRSARLLEWIQLAIEHILKSQRGNGSYDSVGPFTQDHGVTLQAVYTLCTVQRHLDGALPVALTGRMSQAVRAGCAFAARSDEDYAFISNHQALFALAWLRGGALLGDDALRRRGVRAVESIMARQAPEGWYPEYDGADPGYQSLGMWYLAQFQREAPSAVLADSLQRAVQFMSHFVHPDGGFGGGYGSRMTSLWFPAGFEDLAADHALAGAVADAVAEGIAGANVVTPETTDVHNLAVLLHSYFMAGHARAARAPAAAPSLPRDTVHGVRSLGASGLVVAGAPPYYAIVNTRRGGAGAVYSRPGRQLVFEDAGFVAQGDHATWSSAHALRPEATGPGPDRTVTIRQQFGEVNRVALDPWRFVLLRLLNLILFRSVAIGAMIRRRIVDRLISGQREGPLALQREIEFGDDHIRYRDRMRRTEPTPVRALFRARAHWPVHMGSTRYFHGRDLTEGHDIDEAVAVRVLDSSGNVELRLTLRFPADGGLRMEKTTEPVGAPQDGTSVAG